MSEVPLYTLFPLTEVWACWQDEISLTPSLSHSLTPSLPHSLTFLTEVWACWQDEIAEASVPLLVPLAEVMQE